MDVIVGRGFERFGFDADFDSGIWLGSRRFLAE